MLSVSILGRLRAAVLCPPSSAWLATLSCLSIILAAPSLAQEPTTTVLDGVYTSAQADRGARVYEVCAHCHEGVEPDADPLTGPVFIERWREAPLSFLHGFISNNMPGDDAGSLSADAYVDVVAWLVKANGFPAGDNELTLAHMDDILFVDHDGAKPLPFYSLVSVVGCFELDAGDDDIGNLTAASGYGRVRTADETTPEELARSAALPAGSASYRLRNMYDFSNARSLVGQRVQAKGVLSNHNPPTVNVLSLEGVGAACGQ